MRQRSYLRNLVNSTHSMQIEYKSEELAKANVMWSWEIGGGVHREANSLFRSTWFHILWWRRWVDEAPARRAGCCAAAPSPWWPRWPGTELFRQEHVNKWMADPQPHAHTHTCILPSHSTSWWIFTGTLLNVYTFMIEISITVQTVEDPGVTPSHWKSCIM